MIATLGILSLFQLVFVPGLILAKAFKIKGFWENLLAAIGLSQLFNFVFVVVATLCNIYSQTTTLILFGLEVIVLSVLYFPNLNTRFGKIVNLESIKQFFNEYTSTIPTNIEWKKRVLTYLYYFFFLVAALVVIKNFFLYAMHPTQVFTAWDTVASWNRWATQWFHGMIPTETRHYPQLWTANLSIPYQFIGTTVVPYFSKYFANLVEFFIVAFVFVLGLKKKDIGYFIGVIFVSWLMGVFGSQGNGYADSPVALWGLMTVSCLLLSENREDEDGLILLGAFFAAGAALTKQTGMSMILIYPVLVFLIKRSQSKKYMLIVVQSIIIMVLLAAPWYIFKEIQINLGIDASEVSANVGLAINSRSWIEVMRSAHNMFLAKISNPFLSINVTFICLIVLSAFSWNDKFWRRICGLVIFPFWVGWMLLISYDTRNLVLIMPLFGISVGVGIRTIFLSDLATLRSFSRLKNVQLVIHFLTRLFNSILKFFSFWKIWYLLLLVPVLFIVPRWISDSRLIEHSILKQRDMGDPYVNKQIYYYKDNYGLDGKIITPYVYLAFLPELDEYSIYYSTNSPDFIDKFNDPEVGYFLFDPAWLSEDVHDFIFGLIDEKKIQIIYEFEPPSQNGYIYFVTTCHGVCK